MRRLLLPSITAVLVLAAWLAPRTAAQDKKGQPPPKGPSFTKEIRPLLQTYCTNCHNAKKNSGELDLDKLKTEEAALDWPELWDHVGDRLRAKEMPPMKAPQPKDEERAKLLAWVAKVGQTQVSCDKVTKEQIEKSVAGYAMTRRLNRTEYNYTLRDLIGFDVRPGELLPSEGGGGEGFDNTGGTLFTTPTHLEKYLDAAELVTAALLPADGKTPKKVDGAQWEAARKRLLVAVPGPKLEAREAARKVLTTFMNRAFRRPVTDKELDRYLSLFEKAQKRGDSYEQSLKLALKGVLISPYFLFVIEPAPEKEGPYRLGHYQIASRLSYFLWASMPDDELFQLAAAGKLHDATVLKAQVRRMAADPRSRGLAESFAVQWLGLRSLGVIVRPDAKLFPEFNDELASAMRDETVLFIDAIVRENRSVLEIIDARYTFLNERLAKLYKIDGVKGTEMRRVELKDPQRGGILGHAGILTVTSHPHRTSPVLRGRWILEELLGAEVPPPPPNVPELGAKDKKDKDKPPPTLRQQLESHRSKTECASCHNRMDPLGFGLENYDVLGRWRTEEDGKPLDTSGVLPTGEKFNGPAELKKLLLEGRRPEFLCNLSRKLLGFALSRELNRYDMCVVDDCVKALEKGDYRALTLVDTIVLSYPFSHRYHKN
jgi:hypothetical protein